MSRNYRVMELGLYRIDVCDLLLALNLVSDFSDSDKWQKLHDRIKFQLGEFDKNLDLEEIMLEELEKK